MMVMFPLAPQCQVFIPCPLKLPCQCSSRGLRLIAERAVCLTCHWKGSVEREGPDGGAECTGIQSRKSAVLLITHVNLKDTWGKPKMYKAQHFRANYCWVFGVFSITADKGVNLTSVKKAKVWESSKAAFLLRFQMNKGQEQKLGHTPQIFHPTQAGCEQTQKCLPLVYETLIYFVPFKLFIFSKRERYKNRT